MQDHQIPGIIERSRNFVRYKSLDGLYVSFQTFRSNLGTSNPIHIGVGLMEWDAFIWDFLCKNVSQNYMNISRHPLAPVLQTHIGNILCLRFADKLSSDEDLHGFILESNKSIFQSIVFGLDKSAFLKKVINGGEFFSWVINPPGALMYNMVLSKITGAGHSDELNIEEKNREVAEAFILYNFSIEYDVFCDLANSAISSRIQDRNKF